MRHREHATPLEALNDYRQLRRKVEQEGGQHYDKPVLVRFADKGTFEVMDRDIVEDEFYVRRIFKIVRELDPKGADLEQAIRESRGGDQRQPSQRGPSQRRPGGSGRDRSQRGPKGQGQSRRGGRSRRGSRRGGGSNRPPGGQSQGGKPQGGPPSTPPAP